MAALPAVTTQVWAVAADAFLRGVGGTLWTVNSRTIPQRLVPDELLGRFSAASRLFSWGAMPLGARAYGPDRRTGRTANSVGRLRAGHSSDPGTLRAHSHAGTTRWTYVTMPGNASDKPLDVRCQGVQDVAVCLITHRALFNAFVRAGK